MIRSVCLAFLASAAAAHALVIQLDYTYDIANGGNFFGNNPAAKASLEQAAADLGAAILPSLAAISTDVYSGSSGASTGSVDWELTFDNPVTASEVTLDPFSFAADTVRVYVGMRQLGTTLGVGGPGGFAFSVGVDGPTGGRVAAFDQAEAASNAAMSRGGGPIIGRDSGSFETGGGNAAFTLVLGSMIGSVSFDTDTLWYFGLSPSVPMGQNDFYSVALHELLHAIGFGTAETWEDQRSGTTWLGSEAIALAGSGSNLVTGNGHIREGVMSFRVSDGVGQEAVMDPTVTVGTRKSLTQLDLAFLRDLGYVTVPEPATAALLVVALTLAGTRRCRNRADR